MQRLKELGWNFGFKILLPRLCLFGIVPAIVLLGPGNVAWLDYWSAHFDTFVLALSGMLLALSVASGFAVSRYLRRHQTAESPYHYSAEYDCFTFTDYFRIQVKDRAAFRRLVASLRNDHKGQTVWVWLWLDDIWMLPAALMLLVGLLMTCASWLLHRLRKRPRSLPPNTL